MLYYIRQTDDINVKESMCFYAHESVFGVAILCNLSSVLSQENLFNWIICGMIDKLYVATRFFLFVLEIYF